MLNRPYPLCFFSFQICIFMIHFPGFILLLWVLGLDGMTMRMIFMDDIP